jgi:exodeoxyribonuclease V beta subunit
MKSRINEPLPVQSIDQIQLDNHAVIEASAGTGKTYTIEHLVVELLMQEKVLNLDEILVVTFTEKAAAELKNRIREIILKSLQNAKTDILQTALDNFDTASIYTIHGFCNKILQEYAFENGEQFKSELSDDKSLYRKMLYQIFRDDWHEEFGADLLEILKLSQFSETTGNGKSKWVERVIEISLRYQP